MPFVGAGPGVELHCYDDDFTDPWRSAPTMLLRHGFSRNGRFWYSWVPLLSRQLRILRLDMRGMGHSTVDQNEYGPSLDILVEDVKSILDHLGIEKVAYVGESFGGILGPNFAHRYPERIHALVLCNTPPPAPPGALRPERGSGRRPKSRSGDLAHRHHQQPAGHLGGAAGAH